MSNVDYNYKIILIGESNVGKTSILYKFVDDKFFNNYIVTIGIDYKNKIIKIEEKSISLKIWDTAGEERFRTLSFGHFKNCDGVALIFDLSDKKTFGKINYWLQQINLHIKTENISIVLLGNKCDINEKANFDDEIDKLTKKLKIKIF